MGLLSETPPLSPWELAAYQYDLPPDLIAQHPVSPRDQSRLLVFDRRQGTTKIGSFTDIVTLVNRGDLLVLNETRVIPARLKATRETGGRVEIFLLTVLGEGVWDVLGRPGRALAPGRTLKIKDGLCVQVLKAPDEYGKARVRFNAGREQVLACGSMPLPPYIRRQAGDEDTARYQTVYASVPGSVAAPTAGLHFTETVLQALRDKGAGIAKLVLQVGMGTFLPVKTDDIRQHRIHSERYSVPADLLPRIQEVRRGGGRVLAVGTTVARALESAWGTEPSGETRLFIYPPYTFHFVDALLTNFHLPGSTLLMLVAAFLGKHPWPALYERAIQEHFRFYSYGDAMLIL
jgi:S-adenosylmethionine:tRNA ribosyltransferase-isomerase